MRICVVIPMYNEEAIIAKNIEEILPYARALPTPATLVAVNDGSRDRSGSILLELDGRYPDDVFHAISYEQNRGYGGALKAGSAYAIDHGFDYALFMDSDLTNHPKYLTLFYDKMSEGWDYIKASRYISGGAVVGVPWSRRMISMVGNRVARSFYQIPIRDCTNGFRAVRVALLRQMDLREFGFPIIMEELSQAKALGATFCEVPYTLTARGDGDGQSHFSYDWKTWWNYLAHARNASRTPHRNRKS